MTALASAAAPADPVSRRRTFAIISHPDAGKTTLTEKLLLFGGAIQLAGEVKAKRNRGMELISIPFQMHGPGGAIPIPGQDEH